MPDKIPISSLPVLYITIRDGGRWYKWDKTKIGMHAKLMSQPAIREDGTREPLTWTRYEIDVCTDEQLKTDSGR